MEHDKPGTEHSAFDTHEGGAAGGPREQGQAAGRALRDEINRCLDEIRSVSDEQLPEVRQRLEALLAEAQRTGSAYYDSVRHSSSRLASAASREFHESCAATEAYVQQRPWQALAVVGAVSFLSGLLLRRR